MNCFEQNCSNKVFCKGFCIKHYRYNLYGECIMDNCFSPACGKKGLCDNCSRRGEPKRRHIGKHFNTKTHKYCSLCNSFKNREDFYIDRGHTAYICKKCHMQRQGYAKRRKIAMDFGLEKVLQTSSHLCVKCWKPFGEWEVDHIVPYSLGGTHEVDNLQIMCKNCNRVKSNNESIDYRVMIGEQ